MTNSAKMFNELLKNFFTKELKNKEPFNCEFTFQFALAWYLKEQYKAKGINIEIEFESKDAYTDKTKEGNRKSRCDLVFTLDSNRKVYIELKYIYHTTLKNKGTSTTSVGARKSFIKDVTRLKERIINSTNQDERYCIFLTNWPICYRQPKENENDNDINAVLKQYNNNYRIDKQEWISCEMNTESDKPFMCLILDVTIEEPQISYDEVMKSLSNDSE